MAKSKVTKTVQTISSDKPVTIPTGILPEQLIEELPEVGEENIVYRVLVDEPELREMQITNDYIWYDGEFHDFSFDAKIYGAYFERYQKSVADMFAGLITRIEALEGKTEKVLCDVTYSTADGGAKEVFDTPPYEVAVGDYIDTYVTGDGYNAHDGWTIESLEDGENHVYNGWGNVWITVESGIIKSVAIQNTDLNWDEEYNIKVVLVKGGVE